ncbi:MAG TPA: hypothetical protein VFI34_02780 [Candidatus Limnocylindrales bacterium]|nr:hypothetical protein [Candidatus Limnocylindrales bacterium]
MCRHLLVAATLVATLLAGCMAGASTAPSTSTPVASASASDGPVVASPSATTLDETPAASALPADLGPRPTIDYPEVQSLTVATLELSRPAGITAHFWLTCEWATTASVSWVYARPATLLGETIYPELGSADGFSFAFVRGDHVAPYATTAATTEHVTASDDASIVRVEFAGLGLNPDAWGAGPLPTPRAAFEQPLGGRADTASLDGTVSWSCGNPPATVPTPGPPQTQEPIPSLPFDHLPNATIHVGDERAVGQPGCGASWEGYGSSGGDSCGPSYQVLEADQAVHGSVGDRLRFGLPAGFHFTSWALAWIDQDTAAYWRSEEPPNLHRRAGESSIEETTLSLPGLAAGDWSVRLEWSGTDGALTVVGQLDYFRVIVR